MEMIPHLARRRKKPGMAFPLATEKVGKSYWFEAAFNTSLKKCDFSVMRNTRKSGCLSSQRNQGIQFFPKKVS